MDIIKFLLLLKNSNICNFLYSYGIEKLLDYKFHGLIKQYRNETIESQLVNVLLDSYRNTCEKMNLECDPEFVTEYFIYYIFKHNEYFTIDVINKIMRESIKSVNPCIFLGYDIFDIWKEELLCVLSSNYNLLKDYLVLKNIIENKNTILDIQKNTQNIVKSTNIQNTLIKELIETLTEEKYINLYKKLEMSFMEKIYQTEKGN